MRRRVFPAAWLVTCAVAIATAQPPAPKSGVDLANLDTSVRPQDDFFRYVNGAWLARTEIPADHESIASFIELRDQSNRDVRAIIEDAAKDKTPAPGSAGRQLGDFYASFMDEARVERLGLTPIKPELDTIAALRTPADVAQHLGYLWSQGIGGFGLNVGVDDARPDRYALSLGQGRITLLPDRDYYLKEDAKFAEIRAKYQAYLEQIFGLLGRPHAGDEAKAVIALETEMAKAQWTAAERRDVVKSFNKYTPAMLRDEMPGFDWTLWERAQGIEQGADVIVRQPSFFKRFAALVSATPMDAWKAWLAATIVSSEAPYLSRPVAQARFEFFSHVLNGVQAMRPRWEQGVLLINGLMGEAVGRVYVERHFPPAAKARMERLVANLLEAYRQSIAASDWMTPQTKTAALDKLSKFQPHIGYPDRWRDYQELSIKPDDLAGNVLRAQRFDHDFQNAKLGTRVDRDEWAMTPQTVNAYYAARLNQIVFPAAILQPPFFNVDADDAVNYGSIGAIIGHEIGHGFDDQGRRFDGTGALRDWWTADDDREFRRRATMLVEQFNAFSPIPGMHVNGELTLGENIGDLSGLSIAYTAYTISLAAATAPVIDGLTGDQRFFMGYAQGWRGKAREELRRRLLTTDPHSPDEFRANGPLSNVPAFYETFGVKPGDKMYREPASRVKIW